MYLDIKSRIQPGHWEAFFKTYGDKLTEATRKCQNALVKTLWFEASNEAVPTDQEGKSGLSIYCKVLWTSRYCKSI